MTACGEILMAVDTAPTASSRAPHDDVWDPAHRPDAEAAALGRTQTPLRLVGGPLVPRPAEPLADFDVDVPDLAPHALRGGPVTAPLRAAEDRPRLPQLARAAECFATARRTRPRPRTGATSSTSAAVMAEQVAATTNRRLAARLRYARFPYVRSLDEFDFDFQPWSTANWSTTWPPCASSRRTARRLSGPARLRQDPPGGGPGHHGGRGRLPGLLLHRRRHGAHLLHARREGNFATKLPDLHRTLGLGRRRRGTSPHRHRRGRRVLPRGQRPLRERAPHVGDDQQGPAGLGRRLRRRRCRRGHPRPAHAQGGGVQHQRTARGACASTRPWPRRSKA